MNITSTTQTINKANRAEQNIDTEYKQNETSTTNR